jgi:protein-L-isoaspartate(D-aspartate) O-methyltransferase
MKVFTAFLIAIFSLSCKSLNDTRNYKDLRERMVKEQIIKRGIKNKRVIKAMRKVQRHQFVPKEYEHLAYSDQPLPIGYEQTISQPYIVALMTELLNLGDNERVLEIGTGSGYQAAILAELTKEVYTIEILEPLATSAKTRLKRLGYENVTVKYGDGYKGWSEHAPFDGIIVTCASEHIPEPLMEQLKIGGRMVIPVGKYLQELVLITKTEDGIKRKSVAPVAFVPMTGEAEQE